MCINRGDVTELAAIFADEALDYYDNRFSDMPDPEPIDLIGIRSSTNYDQN